MSFRGRLALFFLLIVVIPIAAIALLVIDVTSDSQEWKADARLSTGLTTALTVYEDEVEAAGDAIAEMLASPDVQAIRPRSRMLPPAPLGAPGSNSW